MTNDYIANISPDARKQCVEQARAWTAQQAARLEVSQDDLLAAICRGWLPDEIERLRTAGELVRRRR